MLDDRETLRCCVPDRAFAADLDSRRAVDLYVSLRDAAIAAHPNDFERAFRCLCRFARAVAPAGALGASDDAHALRVLAALDCDAFFRRWPPVDRDHDDWGLAPPPVAPASQRELEPT